MQSLSLREARGRRPGGVGRANTSGAAWRWWGSTRTTSPPFPTIRPPKWPKRSKARGYTFPYLFDEKQTVAQAYRAACTPDFYVFDRQRKLVYRGQMDSSRPGNDVPVTGEDLRAALDAVLAGQPLSADQKPSLGCNIKWQPGNEPDYFR